MKNRILTFIIGILVGAIIATAGFLIYSKSINKNMNPNERMPIEQNGQMQRPDGNMGEPPAKPDGDFRPQMQNNNI
ncbi:MAG: hypothetical protein IJE68_03060 [Clostridia bacterium]|nr:hypothetical protein [Clostridia bacterium]